jgi:predicted permease
MSRRAAGGSTDVTPLLTQWGQGHREALDRVLPLVYGELRKIAARQLRRENDGHALEPTDLVHALFVQLVDQRHATWNTTVLAIVLVSLNVEVTKPVGDTLKLLGQATIALGLICVGAALDFSSMRAARFPLAIGTAFRLVVMPAIAAGLCFAIGITGPTLSIAMICVAAPVATSAYILSRQLGGDATLMANIITLTTLLSLATIPATLLLSQLLF